MGNSKIKLCCALLAAILWMRVNPGWSAVEQPKTFDEATKLVPDAVVLVGEDKDAQVLVSPALQGRVLTSTFGGKDGPSLGWINPPMIENPDSNPHFNNYGGEDRFWMGPEGGQFSIFFRPGDPQDIDYWYTPAAFNEGAFNFAKDGKSVTMSKAMRFANYDGTVFNVQVSRTVAMIPKVQMRKELGIELLPGVQWVAYQSINKATNVGKEDWMRDKGLLSIWILCMFNPSPQTVVIAPYRTDQEGGTGPLVNDRYFGEVPAERFVDKDNYMAFLADGQYRSKIGIPPGRAKNVIASMDYTNNVLTIARFTLPGDRMYVNSMWELPQKEPFGGDVANSYNDGPVKPGAPPLGGFYELESSSPAYELGVGGSVKHIHQTYHFQGPIAELNKIAKAVLGVDLDEVKPIFVK